MLIKNTIFCKIIKNAKIKWNNLTADEAEKEIDNIKSAEQASAKITNASELNAIRAIAKIASLTEKQINTLINDVYTKAEISSNISTQITNSIEKDKYRNILKILSYIHDEWVRNNPNKFLLPGRNKEFQFVGLKLLPYDEVLSDLIFLQPILEGCGINIEDDKLEETFYSIQREYMLDEEIYSHDALVEKLMTGSKWYSELQGLTTTCEGQELLIDNCLNNIGIAEKMASQVLPHQVTDLHTHLEAVLPANRIVELAREILGKEISLDGLDIEADRTNFGKMSAINQGKRKSEFADDIFHNKEFIIKYLYAIAEEYKKYGIKYVELTTSAERLKSIFGIDEIKSQKQSYEKARKLSKKKKNTEQETDMKKALSDTVIDQIEKDTGVQLRFLLGGIRSPSKINMGFEVNMNSFLNSDVQLLFEMRHKYIKGFDIMRR